MKKQIPFHEYSWNIDGFNNYYPSYITKDANGLYGICSPFLGVEKSGIVSGKEIFDKIGIPEFDLCEWQEDMVLENLRKSIEWDLLNDAHDFGAASWAEETEKKFLEEVLPKLHTRINHRGVAVYVFSSYNPLYGGEYDIRERIFEATSKYIKAPLFYLAYPGHICLDVHYFAYLSNGKYEDIQGEVWNTRDAKSLSKLSKQLTVNDVIIVSKNTKPMFRIDEMYYFCILQVVNLSSGKVRFVEFNFGLIFYRNKYALLDENGKIERVLYKGEVALGLEQAYRKLKEAGRPEKFDHISTITINRTKNAYIKLSNMEEKLCIDESSTIYQFSYDYATDAEIQKVKEIITPNRQ